MPFSTSPAGRKKLVPRCRSDNNIVAARKSVEKAITVSPELTSHDHTVSGKRRNVSPGARRVRIVARMLADPSTAAIQNTVIATSHRSMPVACPGPAAASALSGG